MSVLLKYLKENEWIKDNNVLIVAILSFIATFGTLLIKFSIYIFLKGKLSYWNLSSEYINFNNQINVSDFLFYTFIFIYFITITYIFGKLIKLSYLRFIKNGLFIKHKQSKFINNVVYISTFLLISIAAIITCTSFNFIILFFSFSSFNIATTILNSLYLSFAEILIYFSRPFIFFKEKKEKTKTDLSWRMFTSPLIITILLMSIFRIGISMAESQLIFEVVEENKNIYVIILSNENDYIMFKAEINNAENSAIIYKGTKIIMAKENIIINTHQFDSVKVLNTFYSP